MFQLKNNLGLHIGGGLNILSNFKEIHSQYNLGTYQIFLHSPFSLNFKVIDYNLLDKFRNFKENNNLTFVVHAPFIANLVRNDLSSLVSIYHTIESIKVCEIMGINHYVIHPGSSKGMNVKESLNFFERNVLRICSEIPDNFNLCLETGAGNRENDDMGSLPFLLALFIRINNYNSLPSNLKICVDTLHLFADGWVIDEDFEYFPLIERFTEVLHLNGNESFRYRKGKHIDRHSYISLVESKIYKFTDMFSLFRIAYNKGMPIILERICKDSINKDIEFLRQFG